MLLVAFGSMTRDKKLKPGAFNMERAEATVLSTETSVVGSTATVCESAAAGLQDGQEFRALGRLQHAELEGQAP